MFIPLRHSRTFISLGGSTESMMGALVFAVQEDVCEMIVGQNKTSECL